MPTLNEFKELYALGFQHVTKLTWRRTLPDATEVIASVKELEDNNMTLDKLLSSLDLSERNLQIGAMIIAGQDYMLVTIARQGS